MDFCNFVLEMIFLGALLEGFLLGDFSLLGVLNFWIFIMMILLFF